LTADLGSEDEDREELCDESDWYGMRKFIPQQRCCTSKRTVSDIETRLNWRIKKGDHRWRASRSWRLDGNDTEKILGTRKL